MENINKLISFILGLIVVVIFIAILTGRIKLPRPGFLTKSSATSTPRTSPTPTPGRRITIVNPTTGSATGQDVNAPYHSYVSDSRTGNLQQIPNTGAPTVLLPAFLTALVGGSYLRRKQK